MTLPVAFVFEIRTLKLLFHFNTIWPRILFLLLIQYVKYYFHNTLKGSREVVHNQTH